MPDHGTAPATAETHSAATLSSDGSPQPAFAMIGGTAEMVCSDGVCAVPVTDEPESNSLEATE